MVKDRIRSTVWLKGVVVTHRSASRLSRSRYPVLITLMSNGGFLKRRRPSVDLSPASAVQVSTRSCQRNVIERGKSLWAGRIEVSSHAFAYRIGMEIFAHQRVVMHHGSGWRRRKPVRGSRHTIDEDRGRKTEMFLPREHLHRAHLMQSHNCRPAKDMIGATPRAIDGVRQVLDPKKFRGERVACACFSDFNNSGNFYPNNRFLST